MSAPDFTTNWLKVPRAVVRALSRQPIALRVYLELLCRVSWTSGPQTIAGRTFHLNRGQAVIGRETLALACDLPERPTRTALNVLVKAGLIELQTSKLGTTVTICGYEESADQEPAERPSGLPVDSRENVQAEPEKPPTLKISDQETELSPSRAIPGSTADPDPAPTTTQPGTWLPGAHDLVQRAIEAGVDVSVELDTLDAWTHWNATAPALVRQRLWLDRAIKHAAKLATERATSTSGDRKGPRSARPPRDVRVGRIASEDIPSDAYGAEGEIDLATAWRDPPKPAPKPAPPLGPELVPDAPVDERGNVTSASAFLEALGKLTGARQAEDDAQDGAA